MAGLLLSYASEGRTSPRFRTTMHHRPSSVAASLALALALATSHPVAGATATTWTASFGSWTTPTNWTNGTPLSGIAAEIHNGGALFLGAGPTAITGALDLGSGSLNVLDATLISSSSTLGDLPGTLGQLTLSRQSRGSQWNAGSPAIIGAAGSGRVTVQSSAVSVTGPLTLGLQTGSYGDIFLAGSAAAMATWTSQSAAPIVVGDHGTGSITVGSYASLVLSAPASIVLGSAPGASGAISVAGSGARWQSNFSSSLLVGAAGIGRLSLTSGATALSGAITLGQQGTGSGSLLIDGAGSSWQSGPLTIGLSGKGSLRVQNGGVLTSASDSTLGSLAGSAGDATVTGASSQWRGSVTINHGTLTIADSGTVQGNITLTGPDATLVLGDDARIQGTLSGDGNGHVEFINAGRYAPTFPIAGSLPAGNAGHRHSRAQRRQLRPAHHQQRHRGGKRCRLPRHPRLRHPHQHGRLLLLRLLRLARRHSLPRR